MNNYKFMINKYIDLMKSAAFILANSHLMFVLKST